MRTVLRGMDPGQRAQALTIPEFADALLQTHPLVSGILANEMPFVEEVHKSRLEGLFTAELAEIAELENTVSEAKMICDLARVDLHGASETDAAVFEDFVKPIETKQSATWLVRHNPSDPVIAVFAEKKGTAEFQRLATPDEIGDGVFFKSDAEYQASRAAA